MIRRTRIVATLGPATDRPGVLEQLLAGGLDVARINFSHGSADEHVRRVRRLRELSAALNRPVAVLGDLPGPKLRVQLGGPLQLEAGQRTAIARTETAGADLRVAEPEAFAAAAAGERVLLDDGRLQGRIEAVHEDRIVLVIEQGGTLLPNKGVNLPDTRMKLPAVTPRDREALAVAAAAGVDWLALSFVREASAARELREQAAKLGLRGPVLAKMERPEAIVHAESIVQAFDGIMVARGDLGVEIPLEKVPHVQKRLIMLARLAGKPVITATDMLDSMRSNSRPTRAEASDVANAVYDGTDAVMLSAETAVGDFPVEALSCMERILREGEKNYMDDGPRPITLLHGDYNDHITECILSLARALDVQAILAPSRTGTTARLLSRHRSLTPIVAVTASVPVYRQLALSWGVQAILSGTLEPGVDRLDWAVRAAWEQKALRPGRRVLVLADHPIEAGPRYPTLRLIDIGPTGPASLGP